MPDYNERKLIQIHASVVDHRGIAVVYREFGTIGKHKWASKPTGALVVANGDYHEVDFANAYIAQQLPNASVHIKGITRSNTDAQRF